MQEINIAGFDRSSRSWVTGVAEQGVAEIPKLDGRLLTDETSLDAGADDFGHVRHLRPIAVISKAAPTDAIASLAPTSANGVASIKPILAAT